MKILVINAGSSSLKYQLIETDTNEVLAKGLCERIGIDGKLNHKTAKGELKGADVPMKNHADAIKAVIESITSPEYGCISSLSEIDAVGHRVVHGSETFSGSVRITRRRHEVPGGVLGACSPAQPPEHRGHQRLQGSHGRLHPAGRRV